jgi:hypothetical protein
MQIHRKGWPRDSWTVANLQTQAQDEANGELIVRAVNTHVDLIDALEAFLCARGSGGDSYTLEEVEHLARQAIARAKGGAK